MGKTSLKYKEYIKDYIDTVPLYSSQRIVKENKRALNELDKVYEDSELLEQVREVMKDSTLAEDYLEKNNRISKILNQNVKG